MSAMADEQYYANGNGQLLGQSSLQTGNEGVVAIVQSSLRLNQVEVQSKATEVLA